MDSRPTIEVDLRTSIRPTVAEIDLGAVTRNLRCFQDLVGSSGIFAVVKADAYGHGAVPVARALAGRSAALAVSLVEEGLELRAAGIRTPIVVLGAYYDQRHLDVLEESLTPVVYDPADLERFAEAAVIRGRPAEVHLKVDTGMSRLGVAPADLPAVLDRAAGLPLLRVAGICTHFASADAVDAEATEEALGRFQRCLDLGRARLPGPLVNHAANSAAAVRFESARLDAVRPGLALYGLLPGGAGMVPVPGLEPALRLTTRLMALREIPAGTPVSYGGLWRAARPSRIATLPVGYADGYPRHVQGAEVLLRGRRVPVVGAVCMDMMMIDVTEVPEVALEDEVTLIGRDGNHVVSVDEVARRAGTIAYEILCGISKRVPRIYRG